MKLSQKNIHVLQYGGFLFILACYFLIQTAIVRSAPSATDLTITAGSVQEGNSGTVSLPITITRSGNTSFVSEVTVQTTNDTAVAGEDFAPINQVVTLGIGINEETLNIPITGDLTVEATEQFTITISNLNPVTTTISIDQAVGTIINDDSASVSLIATNGAEDSYQFAVTLSQPVDQPVVLELSADTSGGTASLVSDFITPTTTITFPQGTTTNQIGTIGVLSDMIVEQDETFILSIDSLTAGGHALSGSVVSTTNEFNATILNDDAALITISESGPILEGGTITYTATLQHEIDSGIVISYATSTSGTATSDTDFEAVDDTLTFTGSAGESQSFTISTYDDSTVEGDETIVVDFGIDSIPVVSETFISILDSITSTIQSTDTTTVDLVGGRTITETDSGNVNITYSIILPNEVEGGFALPLTITGGTADAVSDFIDTSGLITFTGITETKNLTLTIVADTVVEADETLSITLGTPISTTQSSSIAVTGIPQNFTILDDDEANLTITPVAVNGINEGDTASQDYLFEIELDNEVQDGFSLQYETSDGTATSAGGDYTQLAGQLTFSGEVTQTQFITVEVTGDTIVETHETFNLTLTGVEDGLNKDLSDRIFFQNPIITGTIVNDDLAQIVLGFSDFPKFDQNLLPEVAINEGDAGPETYQLEVELLDAVQGGFSISYTVASETATQGVADDYVASSGSLTFSGTASESKFIFFDINGDTSEEQNETFLITLGDIHNTLISPVFFDEIDPNNPIRFEITNDDGTVVKVTSNNDSIIESDTDVTFTVALDSSSFTTVTVDYETVGITADPNSDFDPTSGSLIFSPGETIKNVTVNINQDSLSEADETFWLELSNATGATIGNPGQALVTILDDDGFPSISFNSGEISIDENGGSVPVTVTLSRISSNPITVFVGSTPGSAADSADYGSIGEFLVFPAGTTVQSFNLTPVDDSIYERDESFTVGLSNFSNVEPGTIISAEVTIIENDVAPTISISDGSAKESDLSTTMFFTVTLSEPAAVDISVSFATQDGNAKAANGDYVPSAGRLTIPAGQTSATIDVSINGDTIGEADEYFSVILSAPSDGSIAPSASEGIGTIENDDPYRVLLPILNNGQIDAPDLIPTSIVVDGEKVSISIRNIGIQPVVNSFWVDLFVDPSVLPTKPNHTTESLGETGLVWLVSGTSLPINPQETITISLADQNYRPDFSDFTGTIPQGTLLVVHVDSANSATTYGAIEETHEKNNGRYNNIITSVTAADMIIP